MTWLIFDRPGGAGAALAEAAAREGAAVELDHATDRAHMRSVRARVLAARPSAVVVASAWDDVVACEADPATAFARNAEDLIHVAAAALEARARVVLLSPAEVYGQSGGPFGEGEVPAPSCVWAETRLRGEVLLGRAARGALILRSGPWLAPRASGWGALAVGDDGLADAVAIADVAQALGAAIRGELAGVVHLGRPEPIDDRPTRRQLALALGAPSAPAPRPRLGRAPVLLGDRLRTLLPRPLAPWPAALAAASTAAGAPAPRASEPRARETEKAWGRERVWAATERYAAKLLSLRAGARTSLHYHRTKDETLHVLSGRVEVEQGPTVGRARTLLTAGDGHHIPAGVVHRLIAVEDAEVLEASTPEGDDVIRVEDARAP